MNPLSGKANPVIVNTLALLTLILASASIIHRLTRDPNNNLKPYQGMGEAVAQQAAQLLGGSGEVVLLDAPGSGSGHERAVAQFKKSAGALTVKSVQGPRHGEPPATREQLEALIAQSGKADAVVVMSDSVDLESLKQSASQGAIPRMVIMTADVDSARELLRKNIVSAAIVPRFRGPPEGFPEPKTPREWFNNFYETLTPGDLGEEPAPQ
jgi:hypothetical protein